MSGQIFQGNHLIAETNDAPLGFEQGGIEVTQAQYDQLVEDDNVAEDTNYYITDTKVIMRNNEKYGDSINDSVSSFSTTYSSKKIDNQLEATNDIMNEVLENEQPAYNLMDYAEIYANGFGAPGSLANFKDFCAVIVPVEPGKTYYLNAVVQALTLHYLDSSKALVVTSSAQGSSITVPSNQSIAYLSIPMNGNNIASMVISDAPISTNGNLGPIYYGYCGVDEQELRYHSKEGFWRWSDKQSIRIPLQSFYSDEEAQAVNPSYNTNTYYNGALNPTNAAAWWKYFITKSNKVGFGWKGGLHANYNVVSATAPRVWQYGINSTGGTTNYSAGFIIIGKNSLNMVLAVSATGQVYIMQDKQGKVTSGKTYKDWITLNDATTSPISGSMTSEEASSYDFLGKKCWYERTDRYIDLTCVSDRFIHWNLAEIEALVDNFDYSSLGADAYHAFTFDEFEPCFGFLAYDASEVYMMQYFCSFFGTAPVTYAGTSVKVDTDATKWSGKEWYCYGTSMTAENYHGYAEKLATLSGMNIHNYGLGGSGIIPALHPSDNTKTRCMRTSDGKADADLITVEIIPNDMSGTLGTATDTSDATFLGNLNQILQYLQENCPKAQIVILTATRSRYNYQDQSETYPPESANVSKWIEWEDGVKEVCRRNCVQYWNGTDNCGLGYHRVKSATSGNTYVQDQIHLTDVGALNLAEYFFSKLKQLPLWHTTYDI